MIDVLLPGLPAERILARYRAAPGREIESGKFASPESSSALVANTFGLFVDRAPDLPPLTDEEQWGWPATWLDLEVIVRFPWAGGEHPCLDVVIETPTTFIGVESKRYEPFRHHAIEPLSEAYWRDKWGQQMRGYKRVRDGLRDAIREGSQPFARLDAGQLVKHAFGLRTVVQPGKRAAGKRAVLFYLFAEPARWPDGRLIERAAVAAQAEEVLRFAEAVEGDKVTFRSCSYRELLAAWARSGVPDVCHHAAAVLDHFDV